MCNRRGRTGSNRAVARWAGAAVVALSLGLLPGAAVAQESTTLVQAGSGVFSGAALYEGVRLKDIRCGVGADVAPIGVGADGDVSCTMSGRSILGNLARQVTLEGFITQGGVSPSGVVQLHGVASMNLGDGSPPLTGLPFSLTVTPNTEGQGTLVLVIDQTALNAALVTNGGVASSSCIPPEIGPSLKFVDRDNFAWTGTPAATLYHVYRGTITVPMAFNHTCLGGPLATPAATDPALPPLGQAFYYLVSASNACGEDSLGVTSPGAQRPNSAPCP
ncbi:MAG TPA: hypothetical protein VJV75_07310 [Candidatus Polarisedimenticolia bacterium]|nr:hypothetical protein [Candidatus Polarisedimenticolia bacterium]